MKKNYSGFTDCELAGEFSRGKTFCDAAFAELYRRYCSQILGYAKCMTFNGAIAEEIFQNTFIALYNNLTGGARPANLKAYLYATARNLYINEQRSRKNYIQVEPDTLFIDERPMHEQNELLDLIVRALPLLDEKYREAFILREFDGMAFSEIAEITGIGVSGAKSRVARAHRLLQKALDPYMKDLYR